MFPETSVILQSLYLENIWKSECWVRSQVLVFETKNLNFCAITERKDLQRPIHWKVLRYEVGEVYVKGATLAQKTCVQKGGRELSPSIHHSPLLD